MTASRRGALGAAVGFVLAEAAACAAAPHRTFERPGFTATLLDGDVRLDEASGDLGRLQVEFGSVVESVAWMPIGDVELGEFARGMVEQAFELRPAPPFAPATVDGQPALETSFDTGKLHVQQTYVDCRSVGLRLTLFTFGPPKLVRIHHADAAASLRCANVTLAAPPRAPAWSFVGDPSTKKTEARPGDAVFVLNGGTLTLVSHDNADLDGTAATFELAGWKWDEGSSRTGGPGTWLEISGEAPDGRVRVRFEHHACGERGYVSYCTVPFDAPDFAVCEGLSACAADPE